MTQPFQVTPIESLAPYLDARNATLNSRRVQLPTVALDGKNFFFDVLGPKSGFANEYLSYLKMGKCQHIHSVKAGGRIFVFTQDAILAWRIKPPYAWDVLRTFDSASIVSKMLTPWSVIFLNGIWYFFHEIRGSFSATLFFGDTRLFIESLLYNPLLGIITNVKKALIVRGRAVLVNADSIQWSKVGDVSDFTPSLGGAGVQIIAMLKQGEVITAKAFADGFIVWTTKGSIRAEYIGGDLVWRFTVLFNQMIPLSPWATTDLPTGETVVLSEDGLMIASYQDKTLNWAKEFNEYLKVYIAQKGKSNGIWRLEYDAILNLLFVMESTNGEDYWRSFVLTPNIGRWGVFSVASWGILQLATDQFGYVGKDLYAKYFTGKRQTETLPPANSVLNRYLPRIEKISEIASSTVVCNSYGYATSTAIASEVILPNQVAWYDYHGKAPAPKTWGGLDSEILIGYLRPPNSSVSADGFIEIQELVLGTPARKPPNPMDWTSDWKPDMYVPVEEWGTAIFIIEDWNLLVVPDVDWNILIAADVDWNPIVPTGEDWNTLTTAAEDWESIYSALPEIGVELLMETSEDGMTFNSQTPLPVRFNLKSTQYSVLTDATFHRLRVTAEKLNHYYHLSYIALTQAYGGELA